MTVFTSIFVPPLAAVYQPKNECPVLVTVGTDPSLCVVGTTRVAKLGAFPPFGLNVTVLFCNHCA